MASAVAPARARSASRSARAATGSSTRSSTRILLTALLVLTLAGCGDEPQRASISAARTVSGPDGLVLEVTQRIELSETMHAALDHGIALRLVYRIDACGHLRQRALWLRHAPLKRQYELQREGDAEIRGFARLPLLAAALDRVRLPLDLPGDEHCAGSVQVRLDQAALPTPLRFPAFVEPAQWRLSSARFAWEAR